MASNFQKYIQDSKPVGICKADVYKSQEMLMLMQSLGVSVDNNIKSGMFEEDMLAELKEIKKLLKTDLSAAVQRSNDYAPTVQAMNAGVQGSSSLPIVPQGSLDWLTEKRIADPAILGHNLALIKKLWGQAPVGSGVSERKPMTETYGDQSLPSMGVLGTVPSHNVDGVVPASSDVSDEGRFHKKSTSSLSSVASQVGSQAKDSASQALSAFKWMGAPASPYLDIAQEMWKFVKPLRTAVSETAKAGVGAAKYLGRGGVDVIDNAWRDAQAVRKKNKESSKDETLAIVDKVLSDKKVVDVSAVSDKMKPASVEFPTDISINNFGEFEEWLELWLEPLLRDGHVTDLDISETLKDLLLRSDAHLALISFIADKFDLLVTSQQVYAVGVSNVAAKPELAASVGRLALPSGSSDVAIVSQPSLHEVSASSTPLWDAVSSYNPRHHDIEDVDYEDVTAATVRAEEDKDARDELAEATQGYFKGLYDSLREMREVSKEESDQTQEILRGIDVGGKEGSPLGTFFTSLLSGFGSLFSGFTSLFNPTILAGLAGLAGYFMSDTFRGFINTVGKFVFNKAVDFIDPKARNQTSRDAVAVASTAAVGANVASQGLGAASRALDGMSKVSRVAAVANDVSGGSKAATVGMNYLSAGQKAASTLAKFSSSGLGKLSKRAGFVGGAIDALGSGLGYLGFDAEAGEMDESDKYDMFKGESLSDLVIDPKLAAKAGLDNLTWRDYVASVSAGAGLGSAVGTIVPGPGNLIGAIVGAISGLGFSFFKRAEAADDYKKFAKENPELFLQMLSSKRAGLNLDRVSFRNADGVGIEGFVDWMNDQKGPLKEAMNYGSTSKTGLLNLLQAMFGFVTENPHTPISQIPIVELSKGLMPFISASPTKDAKGVVTDVNVHVKPMPSPNRDKFAGYVADALRSSFLGSVDIFGFGDKSARGSAVRGLSELGDDGEFNLGFGGWVSSVPVNPLTINERPGLQRKDSSVNLKGVTSPAIIEFANNMPSAAGDVVITSGFRGSTEQAAIAASGDAPYSSATSSPHMIGAAIDLRYSDKLAGFFASKEGYDYLTRSGIDVSFLWAEVDLKNRHFHVQPKRDFTNREFYDPESGWERYKVYAAMRWGSAKRGSTAGDYKADRLRALEGSSGGDSKVSYAKSFLKSKGLTDVQVAGVLGNLHRESNFNTRAINKNDGGPGKDSIGIAQWNRGRLDNLRDFANSNGGDMYDFKTQLDFVWWELQNTHKKAYRGLRAAQSVNDATFAFGRHFEGFKESQGEWDKRYALAHGHYGSEYDGSFAYDSVTGSPSPSFGGEDSSGDWRYVSGTWYSGITNAIKSIGSLFSDKPVLASTNQAGDDGQFFSTSTSATPVVAAPVHSDSSTPTVSPTKLQTASVDVQAMQDSGGSSSSASSGDLGSYVNAPSSSHTVYNNSTVNIKNNLYTKQL